MGAAHPSTREVFMTTNELISALRNWIPVSYNQRELVKEAAARLEKLDADLEQALSERKLHCCRILQKEFDEARAELAQLKDTVAAYEAATVKQQLTVRPEPSRLEIAVELAAAWTSNSAHDETSVDAKWWLQQADALIAAAKEGGK